jgi:ribosome biogenesis GTPase A
MLRFFSSRAGNVSNRQKFRQIVPDTKVLSYLDHLGLGFAKSKDKTSKTMKFTSKSTADISASRLSLRQKGLAETRFYQPIPYPFNRGAKRVREIITANNFGEIRDFGDTPEVAVIGRSNVGKSTLLNLLVGFNDSFVQRAEVSDKPGQTKHLQFFTMGRKVETKLPALVLVDMPGYGFAYMGDEDNKRCFDLVSSFMSVMLL